MELFLIICGAAIFGGLSIFDLNKSDGSDDGDLETGELTEDGNTEFESANNESFGTSNDPLEVALEQEQEAMEVTPQFIDLQPEETETHEALSVEDLIIYDGVSDDDMGYTDKAFGIAHRFYENDMATETLVGGEGDDLIYAGAGSTALGGEGSDDFELFLPNGVFGQEVFVLGDFEPAHETLTILLEQDIDSDKATALPAVDLVSEATNDLQLRINGTPVASINNADEENSIALSVDGLGEVFLSPAGVELSTEELDRTSIRVIYLTDNALFGL